MKMSMERLVVVLWVLYLLLALRFLFTAVNGEDNPTKALYAQVGFWLAFVVTAWWWIV